MTINDINTTALLTVIGQKIILDYVSITVALPAALAASRITGVYWYDHSNRIIYHLYSDGSFRDTCIEVPLLIFFFSYCITAQHGAFDSFHDTTTILYELFRTSGMKITHHFGVTVLEVDSIQIKSPTEMIYSRSDRFLMSSWKLAVEERAREKTGRYWTRRPAWTSAKRPERRLTSCRGRRLSSDSVGRTHGMETCRENDTFHPVYIIWLKILYIYINIYHLIERHKYKGTIFRDYKIQCATESKRESEPSGKLQEKKLIKLK